RYADTKAQKTNYKADLDAFADKDSISDWAADGVNYAVATGLFKGNEKGEFAPQGKASRAELATVLQRVNVRAESRVLCWGDSLTMGIETGWGNFVDIPYPERLGEYLGLESVNLGIGSETSDMIAMRQGGIKMYVNGITIPADCTPVAIYPVAEGTDEVSSFGLYGFEGVNDVEIAGIKGKITGKNGETSGRFNTTIYFTRNEPGEAELKITEPTQIITKYMEEKKENDILVIWVGSNDLYGAGDTSLFETIVANQQAMIDYAGTDEFVIVGYTANTYIGNDSFRECTDEFNKLMAEKWGEKFLDVKAYMATEQCLADQGITPTAHDMEFLNKGWIPPSLLEDSPNLIHFNQLGYDIVADMVAAKIVELGYLN
ncbi:MAG: S-layer homology domain-containing protein, partial [Clostridia bacterium]|nr:S-layer homology domain-containing protein [Clostridia bacterium]